MEDLGIQELRKLKEMLEVKDYESRLLAVNLCSSYVQLYKVIWNIPIYQYVYQIFTVSDLYPQFHEEALRVGFLRLINSILACKDEQIK